MFILLLTIWCCYKMDQEICRPLKYVWLPITSTRESERSFLRHFKWFSRQACSSPFWRNDIVTKRINFDKNVSLFCQNWRTLQFIFFQFHNVKKEMNKFFEFYLLSRSDILRRPQKFEKISQFFWRYLAALKTAGDFWEILWSSKNISTLLKSHDFLKRELVYEILFFYLYVSFQ